MEEHAISAETDLTCLRQGLIRAVREWRHLKIMREFEKREAEKRAAENAARAAWEEEMLFGDDVDHFLKMQQARVLANICRHLGNHQVRKGEIWVSICAFVKWSEFHEFLGELMSSEERQRFFDENFRWDRGHRKDLSLSGYVEILYRERENQDAVVEWLTEVLEKRVPEYKAIIESKDFKPRLLQQRFEEVSKSFELDEHEQDIVMACFILKGLHLRICDFYIQPGRFLTDSQHLAWAAGLDEYQISGYFTKKSKLWKFGIVGQDGSINHVITQFITGLSQRALSSNFWNKCTAEALPWEFHGKIAEKHGKVIAEMVRGKSPEQGCSILFYGAAGAGKTSFAISLAKQLGCQLYFVGQDKGDFSKHPFDTEFRYTALMVAQRQVDPKNSILVVDECDDMLEANKENAPFGKFVPRKDGAEATEQLNTVMDENRHVVIWICNSQQDAIAKSSRRRFDYSVLFDELLPETRVHIWENCLKKEGCEGKLTAEFISDVSRTYRVNAGGIALAVKNAAALVAADPEKCFTECVGTFLRAHCALLGIRKSNDERLEPARDYSLEGLNIKGGIQLQRIIQVCRNFLEAQGKPGQEGRDRPRMNLLLHGVPGSGKTEFVKYLAKSLGKKLNIKNASELLSKYVGGTEHLLAAAFAEAEKNNEMLFIDEGDSMLSSRDGAQRSWEVSQVNTLLTEMENFNGIFVVSTNLIQKLDPAALRRFTFRIHFDFLDDQGKELFYKTYFGPMGAPKLTKADREALHAIQRLTPSDYRNVRQQLFYLEDETLEASEIIDALKQEAQSRDSYGSYKGLGEEKHGIGFI